MVLLPIARYQKVVRLHLQYFVYSLRRPSKIKYLENVISQQIYCILHTFGDLAGLLETFFGLSEIIAFMLVISSL